MNDIQELNDMLASIDDENKPAETQEQTDVTVVKFGNKEIDVNDDDAIMAAIFGSALEDKNKADELYSYYVSRIEMDKDRSDSVREGLAKSVELRQNVTGNLIRLLDLKKKYNAKNSGNSLVNLQLSPRETNIDINRLTDEILNE